MCRYRYYSAHKTPQSHLKVVSCWNTLAASKLGSKLKQTAQAWPSFCTSHSSPMGNGCKLCFCWTNLFPSSKPSMDLHWKEVVYFRSWGGDISGESNFGKFLNDFFSYVFKKNSAILTFSVGVFMFRNTFCALSICDKKGGRGWNSAERGHCSHFLWRQPSFLPPTHFFPEPIHFKSWPGPVCHVTCLPKGSFQINSSSPWDACPPHWEPFQRHHLLIGGVSQRKRTLLNQDFISWYCYWV